MKILLFTVLFTTSIMAHHGPQEPAHHEDSQQIRLLTEMINTKADCKLLTLRAQEYFKLGKKEKALHDIEHALKLDGTFVPAKTLLKKLK